MANHNINYQLKVNGNVLGLFSESLPALEKAFKYIRSIKNGEGGGFAKVTIYEYHVDNPRKKRKDLFNDEVDINNIKDSKLYRLLIKKRDSRPSSVIQEVPSLNSQPSTLSIGRVKSVSTTKSIENTIPVGECDKQYKARGRKKEVSERVENKVPVRRNRKSEPVFEPREESQNQTFTPSFLDELLFTPQSTSAKVRGKRAKQ